MAENMFEIRRKQIIKENLDVADQILNTNPFIDIIPEEIEVEDQVTEQVTEQEDNLVHQFKISLLKREKIKKGTFNYYLEDSIDELVDILSNKMGISKSEVVSLLLKSAILTNDDIQNLSEIDIEIKNLLEKLKK